MAMETVRPGRDGGVTVVLAGEHGHSGGGSCSIELLIELDFFTDAFSINQFIEMVFLKDSCNALSWENGYLNGPHLLNNFLALSSSLRGKRSIRNE